MQPAVVSHPLAQCHLTEMRDASTPPHRFRRHLNLLGRMLFLEATRDLPVAAEGHVPAASDREDGGAVILFHRADMGIDKRISSPGGSAFQPTLRRRTDRRASAAQFDARHLMEAHDLHQRGQHGVDALQHHQPALGMQLGDDVEEGSGGDEIHSP